jgi:GTPases - Sulfate adenylate transferase subunit 1
MNEIASSRIHTSRPLFVHPYRATPETGTFIFLVDQTPPTV